MIGVPGTAHRLFGALREDGISVILISQGSSEHSICFAIPERRGRARRARRAPRPSIASSSEGQIQSVEVDTDCSILAVVGDGMAGSPGVAAKVFNALGARRRQRARHRAGRLGAQHLGGDRRQGRDARAARGARGLLSVAAHDLDRPDRPGRGRPRAARAARVAERSACARLQARPARARHHGVSKKMLLAEQGIRSDGWKAALDASAHAADIANVRRARARRPPAARGDHRLHRGRERGAALRRTGSRAGIHVVTPNKKANSGRSSYYESLQEARRAGRRALPLRSHRRRGPAGHPDAARPARDRRRDHAASKASSPARWPICSTSATARRRSPTIVQGRQGARATPSRIRATTCRARTSRAS